MTTTAVRLFLVFALVSLVGFFAEAATGGTTPVLIGALGMFAAAAAVIAEFDATPAARPAGRRRRQSARTDRRTPLTSWETRS